MMRLSFYAVASCGELMGILFLMLSTVLPTLATSESIQQQQQQQDQPLLLFLGTVLTEEGRPVPNAWVQFWHTDAVGRYDHPQDGDGQPPPYRDTFQYFGTAITDENGTFVFQTYRPGIYVARPVTHIHYKVFVRPAGDNNTTTTNTSNTTDENENDIPPRMEVLTSQFYFADEDNAQQYSSLMQLELVPWSDVTETTITILPSYLVDDDGSRRPYDYFINKTIVIDGSYIHDQQNDNNDDENVTDKNITNSTTLLLFTPSQQEGPFYPVMDFFHVGSDLTQPSPNYSSPSPGSSSSSSSQSSWHSMMIAVLVPLSVLIVQHH